MDPSKVYEEMVELYLNEEYYEAKSLAETLQRHLATGGLEPLILGVKFVEIRQMINLIASLHPIQSGES